MPNRGILNKYCVFVSQVHKVLKKKELDGDDEAVINKARLVAMLSSNHSWRAFKFLHGDSFDRDAITNEIRAAFTYGWREINENDVKEVATEQIDEHAFSMMLNCIESKDGRRGYKILLFQMQTDFVDGIEPIETQEAV